MSEPRYQPRLHRLAVLLAAATFPLIFMGGLVTSHRAGLAVPDWPNSYGYNMFLFPPNQWVGGILYEHTHRLMGTVVGFLSIMLAASAYGLSHRPTVRSLFALLTFGSMAGAAAALASPLVTHLTGREPFSLRSNVMHAVVGLASVAAVSFVFWRARSPEPRRWVRRLTLGVLAAVILQGVLGGLRVVRINLDLAVVHGCFAQAFFCLTALVVVVTSRWWREAPDLSAARDAGRGKRLVRLAVVAVAVIYGQLVVGAIMRHYRAGLAIPDFPLAFGKVLPPTSEAELRAVAEGVRDSDPDRSVVRPTDYGPPGSLYVKWMAWWQPDHYPDAPFVEDLIGHPLGHVWLHFGHRVGALVVSLATLVLVYSIFRLYRGRPMLLGFGLLLVLLLLGQLTLGMLTVLLRKPADVTSVHVAVGALILFTTSVVAVRSMRLYWPAPRRATRGAFEVVPRRSAATGPVAPASSPNSPAVTAFQAHS